MDEVKWSETEQGIRRLGVKIERSYYPRSKIIERIFGKIQSRFQAEPGYVGTNATTDRYPEVQKQARLVRSGQAHPGDFGWYSKEEWTQRLGEILTTYSNEPGEGKWLAGLTPKQAYDRHFTTPLARIPENCRYLLSCNKIPAEIGANGLSFQFGKRRYTYKDERLGEMRFRSRSAIAWFNPENPQLCGVTDESGENPIVVKIETSAPVHDGSAYVKHSKRENAAFERHAKEVYRSVKHVFATDFENRRFRPVVTDGIAAETAKEFQRQSEELTADDRQRDSLIKSADKAGRKLGVRLSKNDPQLERRASGLTILDELGIRSGSTEETSPEETL
jgi:hypothetical protein